ncbi:hypothetical protein [Rhizobium terrae]|uniref:hypothetical protein n=1 Tax=Rhizobium terrae TaxID=2171756 RepID=UPI000E3C8807|nr:hypothetical protein [Rhizobium terrae]
MTKRDFIYLALLISLAIGSIIDVFTWSGEDAGYTLNDITQLVATVVLCVWWEIEDAKLRDGKAVTLTRTMTIFFAPLGLLIYFFQSRKPLAALVWFAGFIGGAVLAIFLGAYLGEWIIAIYPSQP